MGTMIAPKRIRRVAVGAALAAAGTFGWTGTGTATPASPSEHGQHADHDISPAQLDDVRRATAPFHDVANAVASGRVDLGLCVDNMGQHYADPATFGDGVLDAEAPEALVYADDGDRLRLVAVEWVSTTPGEVLGIPLHLNESLGVWVLHAWVWYQNPAGTLADVNSRVGSCPGSG
jgi:hypothetical protein